MKYGQKDYQGTIQRYDTASGPRWRAIGFKDKRRKALGSHKSEAAAIEALRRFYADEPPPADAAPDYDCVATWGPRWLKRREDAGLHRSCKDVRLALNNTILSHSIARVPFTELRSKHVRGWVADQWASRTPHGKRPRRGTILNRFMTLRVMLRDAVREELLLTNPCEGVVIEKEARSDVRRTFLEIDEFWRVIDAKVLTPQSRNMIKFSFFSGLRAGELAGLRWSNIDWEKKVASVQFSYDGPTKAGAPRRVPLMPQAIEALEAQRALNMPYEYVFPGRGGNCRKHSVLRQLKQACKEVGITRNVVAHSLRHSFCTHMSRRFPPTVVKELAGHSAIATTMRYVHTIGEDVEKAVLETRF